MKAGLRRNRRGHQDYRTYVLDGFGSVYETLNPTDWDQKLQDSVARAPRSIVSGPSIAHRQSDAGRRSGFVGRPHVCAVQRRCRRRVRSGGAMAVELRFEQGVFRLPSGAGSEERRPASSEDVVSFRDGARRYEKAVFRNDEAALLAIAAGARPCAFPQPFVSRQAHRRGARRGAEGARHRRLARQVGDQGWRRHRRQHQPRPRRSGRRPRRVLRVHLCLCASPDWRAAPAAPARVLASQLFKESTE
jgi:hypothetical protein